MSCISRVKRKGRKMKAMWIQMEPEKSLVLKLPNSKKNMRVSFLEIVACKVFCQDIPPGRIPPLEPPQKWRLEESEN